MPDDDYFASWPERKLTPAELNLRHVLGIYGSMNAMLYVYVLHRGRLFDAGELPATVRRGTSGQCFQNAAELVMKEPEKYAYVEGYAMGIMPVHHAWCVTRDGSVIDPTWTDSKESAYFGIPMNMRFVAETVLNNGVWGVFGEMPSTSLLRRSTDDMVHPWWREEIAERPAWPKLEAALKPARAMTP